MSANSTTKQQHPSHPRRRSQLFVDIPHSALHASFTPTTSPYKPGSLKENTPLHPLRTNSHIDMSTSSTASRKRKLSNDDSLEDFFEDSASTAPKKTKLSTSATTPPAAAKAKPSGKPKETKVVKEQNPNVPSEEYPNGYFYCHQCNRKRDMSGTFASAALTLPATLLTRPPQRVFTAHTNERVPRVKLSDARPSTALPVSRTDTKRIWTLSSPVGSPMYL